MPLDPDTIDCLDDVKKGKPRRFVMICKGILIKSLVVYKKGSLERYKKQAKEEGKGQFYHGVIDGKGVDITFKLCREDGHQKPPGKELILKDFLNTEADMKFKPVYEIVDVLPELGETDESEGSQVEGEQQETPPEAPPMPETGTYTADDLAAECKRLKLALYPQVKVAVEAHPGQKDAIIRLFALADKHEKAAEFASAIESYQQLSAQLANLPAAKKPDATTGDPANLFNERLKALLPEVKAAAGTPAGDEAKLKVSEAGVLARKKDFIQASALLDQAEAALKKSAAIKTESTNGDALALFNDRLKALLPDVKTAAGTAAGDAAKLKLSEAGVSARKKDFVQAGALLDQAEAALQGTGARSSGSDDKTSEKTAPTGIAPGIVEKRKFLLERWKKIPVEVSTDLATLQQAIERDVPDEDADLLIDLSQDYLNDFCDEMKEAIDDDINAGDAKYKNAISTIQAFRTKIASEPLIQTLKRNTLKAAVTVDAILLKALEEVEQALAS